VTAALGARYARRVRARNTRYEQVEPRLDLEYHEPREFDRIAFAMEALHRLRPKRMKIAVYAAVKTLHVQSGRDLRRGEGATWAMVGIPPHASREHIAYALAELLGVAQVPYTLQMLLTMGGDPPNPQALALTCSPSDES
jgi:hypothetical protein